MNDTVQLTCESCESTLRGTWQEMGVLMKDHTTLVHQGQTVTFLVDAPPHLMPPL